MFKCFSVLVLFRCVIRGWFTSCKNDIRNLLNVELLIIFELPHIYCDLLIMTTSIVTARCGSPRLALKSVVHFLTSETGHRLSWFQYPKLVTHSIVQAFSTLLQILFANFMNKTPVLRTKQLVYLSSLSLTKAEKMLIIQQDIPQGKEFWKLTICRFKTVS